MGLKNELRTFSWFLLRGARARNAIALAKELRDLGFSAEAPTETIRRRVPRKKSFETIERPVLGGWIFSKETTFPGAPPFLALTDISRLRPVVLLGRTVVVSEEELRSSFIPPRPPSELRRGDSVEVCFGPLSGIDATVLSCIGDEALLSTGSSGPLIRISSCLIRVKAPIVTH